MKNLKSTLWPTDKTRRTQRVIWYAVVAILLWLVEMHTGVLRGEVTYTYDLAHDSEVISALGPPAQVGDREYDVEAEEFRQFIPIDRSYVDVAPLMPWGWWEEATFEIEYVNESNPFVQLAAQIDPVGSLDTEIVELRQLQSLSLDEWYFDEHAFKADIITAAGMTPAEYDYLTATELIQLENGEEVQRDAKMVDYANRWELQVGELGYQAADRTVAWGEVCESYLQLVDWPEESESASDYFYLKDGIKLNWSDQITDKCTPYFVQWQRVEEDGIWVWQKVASDEVLVSLGELKSEYSLADHGLVVQYGDTLPEYFVTDQIDLGADDWEWPHDLMGESQWQVYHEEGLFRGIVRFKGVEDEAKITLVFETLNGEAEEVLNYSVTLTSEVNEIEFDSEFIPPHSVVQVTIRPHHPDIVTDGIQFDDGLAGLVSPWVRPEEANTSVDVFTSARGVEFVSTQDLVVPEVTFGRCGARLLRPDAPRWFDHLCREGELGQEVIASPLRVSGGGVRTTLTDGLLTTSPAILLAWEQLVRVDHISGDWDEANNNVVVTPQFSGVPQGHWGRVATASASFSEDDLWRSVDNAARFTILAPGMQNNDRSLELRKVSVTLKRRGFVDTAKKVWQKIF